MTITAIASITMWLSRGWCPVLRRYALNESFSLRIKPLVDIGIVAGSVLHELGFDGAQLVDDAVVLLVQRRVLVFQTVSCFLEIVDPFLLLLTAFGRGNPVPLKELVALVVLIQSNIIIFFIILPHILFLD